MNLGCCIWQLNCLVKWIARQSLSCWRFVPHVTKCIQSVWKCPAVLHWGAGNEPEESRTACKYRVSESTNDPQQLAHKEGKTSSQANTNQIIFLLSTIQTQQLCHRPFANMCLRVRADNKADLQVMTGCRACWLNLLSQSFTENVVFSSSYKGRFRRHFSLMPVFRLKPWQWDGLFPNHSHRNRWHFRATSELTEIWQH